MKYSNVVTIIMRQMLKSKVLPTDNPDPNPTIQHQLWIIELRASDKKFKRQLVSPGERYQNIVRT